MMERLSQWMLGPRSRCCCFHFGRCGSTLLGNMLGSHPDVDWTGEIFHELHESDRTGRHGDPLQQLASVAKASAVRHFGFETKFQHLDQDGLDMSLSDYLSRLQEQGFDRMIILRRRNYLRQAVSVARGQRTRLWHLKSGIDKPAFEPFELDMESVGLAACHQRIETCFEILDRTYQEATRIIESIGAELLTLTYEDDLESEPEKGFLKALDLLGAGSYPARITLQRLDSRPLREMLTNYQSVRDRLSKTPYDWMCTN